jgi:hypothetical protein
LTSGNTSAVAFSFGLDSRSWPAQRCETASVHDLQHCESTYVAAKETPASAFLQSFERWPSLIARALRLLQD